MHLKYDLSAFHPVLAKWFQQKFGQPTDVQQRAWECIFSDSHTLIASPTGSGKTLAALLPCLDRIVKQKQAEESTAPGVRVLYVTPLKALNNDIHHHLFHFIKEMNELAEQEGIHWPGISVGVRTGDTTASTRSSMVKRPPDLLITTPESFYILMTSEKARNMLRTVEQVIIDEIHDLAADKRGVHLSLTLERLVEWCGSSPQRIGVSATQKPLERVAAFLGGWEDAVEAPIRDYQLRKVRIVESIQEKKLDLLVTMPDYAMLQKKDQENVWIPLVERILQLIEGSTTVLIFVNSRRLCERLTLRLNDHVGYELARAHHGSVSRELRLEVERALKTGELRCLVATSSLELGIDVGHVDLVLQIDSPKSAAAGIQRIGRAGHSVGSASRGVIVARNRGDLAEAAVLSRQIAARDIEEIRIPRNSLDVLSQQAVAMIATGDWELGRLHAVVTRSDCYRSLPRAKLEALLQVLAGLFPFSRPLIEWDRETGRLHRRKNTPMAALMGAGTIPQSSGFPVHHLHTRMHLGELEEEFVHESRVGDVFQLGTSSWSIQSIKHDRVYVTESGSNFSEIPFWKGEANGRTYELGSSIGEFLNDTVQRLNTKGSAEQWLTSQFLLDERTADALIALIKSQKAVSCLPTNRRVVVEHFTDEVNQTHLVIHSVFGRRFNRTWHLALQRQYEKTLPFTFYSFAKENGIEFVFPEWDETWMNAFWYVSAHTLESLLMEAIPASPLFSISFRRLAETSLLLSRGFSRMPTWQKRWRSEALLKEAMPYAEHFPFLREAMDECLNELLDVTNVKRLLLDIENGDIEVIIKRSHFPSPFAAQFLADYVNLKMYESDTLGKDLQLQLLSFNKEMAADWFGKDTMREAIEPEVLAAEKARLEGINTAAAEWNEESLYRLLKERGDMSAAELDRVAGSDSTAQIQALLRSNRAAALPVNGEERFLCRDEYDMYASFPHHPGSFTFILHRFIDNRPAFTEEELIARYPLSPGEVHNALEAWKRQKVIEPSPFAEQSKEKLWSSTKVVSHMIRYSVQQFRKKTEPSEAESYCSLLLSVQHVSPETKVQGLEGLRSVIAQLQGVFLPYSYWESIVFPSRITGFRKEDVDLLCASGDVFWIGKKETVEKEGRIAFFLVEAKELYAPFLKEKEQSKHPELVELIRVKGASFLSSLSRETLLAPSELMEKLMDLVWEGYISNDQFAPLRLHKSTASKKNGKSAAFQSGLGRWYDLDSQYGSEVEAHKSAMSWVQHLLQSYGMITKDLAAEHAPFTWDTLQGMLRRLEEWGIVTRGLFLERAFSIQFSTKDMVVRLRNHSQQILSSDGDFSGISVLSAVDPLNPYGTIVEWPPLDGIAFARKHGNYMVFLDGKWKVWMENYGRRIYSLAGESESSSSLPWKSVFSILMRQQGLRKMVIDTWNGKPVAEAKFAISLLELGAEREKSSLVFWPSTIHGSSS